MSEILESLGIDPNDIVWSDLAACTNANTDWFFDSYENDQVLAKNIDEICLVCPVSKMCLQEGMKNNEYGVWGGVYLSLGKVDKARNSHKTQEVWEQWKAKNGQK
jgi:hypothetical protein